MPEQDPVHQEVLYVLHRGHVLPPILPVLLAVTLGLLSPLGLFVVFVVQVVVLTHSCCFFLAAKVVINTVSNYPLGYYAWVLRSNDNKKQKIVFLFCKVLTYS